MNQSDSRLVVLVRVLVYGSSLLFLAGGELHFGTLEQIAVVLCGVGLILAGIEARRTGYMVLWNRDAENTEPLDGVPASTWGIVLISVGSTMILFMVALFFHLDERLERSLARFAATALGQSMVWIIIGGGVVVWGIADLFGSSDRSVLGIVRSIPTRIFGLVLLVAGLTTVVLTILRLVSPLAFDALVSALSGWFASLF